MEKSLMIRADSWTLTARMHGGVNESKSGSSEWSKETVWESANPDPDRPPFALMAPAPSGDWGALPNWAREAALKALGCELAGARNELRCARIVNTAPGPRCLVFESQPSAAEGAIQRLLPHLAGWPADVAVYIACSPTAVRLRLVNCFADSGTLVERVVAAGEALRS